MNKILFENLVLAEKYFLTSKYCPHVERAVILYGENKEKEAQECLNILPTTRQLLEILIEKLKDKSVMKSLHVMEKNQNYDKVSLVTLKGLSSLLTHAIIETDKNPEYRIIVDLVYNKLNEAMGKLE